MDCGRVLLLARVSFVLVCVCELVLLMVLVEGKESGKGGERGRKEGQTEL